MNTFRKPSFFGLAILTTTAFGILLVVGCPAGEAPGANEVFIRSIAFDPAEITISLGESVTWTNLDFIIPHTATSGNPGDDDLGSVFRSVLLSQGETFKHTLKESGEFIYFCEVHPVIMRNAKVIVQGGRVAT